MYCCTRGLITCVRVQSEWNIREELLYIRVHGALLDVSIQIVDHNGSFQSQHTLHGCTHKFTCNSYFLLSTPCKASNIT